MTPYRLGEWTGYILMALVVVWVGTGRWRDHPSPKGRTAQEVAAAARRRTRLFKRSVLAILAVLFLADIVVGIGF
ncbi:hypothetical protein ACF1AB_37230 [Streptomyces sp. NPDC014846]|uniref:hypothetical protein n=1 Tax=Streptomyces sp. NPDC014846 TaxID=3364922 RepID=UPI0036F60FD5